MKEKSVLAAALVAIVAPVGVPVHRAPFARECGGRIPSRYFRAGVFFEGSGGFGVMSL